MSLVAFQKKFLVALMIVTMLAGLIPAVSPLGSSTVLAQAEPAFVRRVRAIETYDLGIPYPAGLAFSPGARAFYVLKARDRAQPPSSDLDILQVTPYEDQGASARIMAAVRDPINVAYDHKASRLLIFQAAPDKLIEVLESAEGHLDPATLVRHDARSFGLENPQGMAVDPFSGHLFFLDASGPRIVRIEPDGDGGFAGALISEIDLSQAGLPEVRGLTLDPSSGHFYIFSPSELTLYEVTDSGQVVTTRDLAGLGLVDPQGLVLAPSADLTDDPGKMHLYIADSGPFSQQTLDASTAESSLEAGAADGSLAAGVGNSAQGSGSITELSFAVLAALPPIDWYADLIQTVDAANWDPPGPDPSGLAYVPSTNHLQISDGEVEETVSGITHFDGVNVWETELDGTVVGTANISRETPTVVPMSDEPTGVAWNPANGHFYFSDDSAKRVFDLNPGDDQLIGTSDDTWTSFDTRAHGNEDPEGITYDTVSGHLFVSDGISMQIYEYTLSGTLVNDFDTEQYGIEDPESVEYNIANDSLFIVSGKRAIPAGIEVTKSGTLMQTIDISAANPRSAAGLAYAPASNGSGEMRFYIVDRGIDNNNDPDLIDGKLYELSMPPIGPVGPTANDDSAGTTEGTPILIDVTANDTDPNGNLDESTANTTCTSGCSGVNNGGLANHGDGTFTYTPDPGFLGTDGFVYEVCDTDTLCATASVTISVGQATIEVRVAASSDDAEESGSGYTSLASSDLELVETSSVQTVGLRFNGVTIPPGATITNAYVQFQADEIHTGATSLTIQGEDVDNAAIFVSATNNVSNRPRTTTSVPWTPAPWTIVGSAGVDQRTPNIAPVIQQIVNRSGWANGNSLVVIITGSGTRTAEAFDGVSAAAPLLHVEYGSGSGNNPPVAVGDAYNTNEDTLLNVTAPGVLGNDTDDDGDPLTASLVSGVSNGSLTLNSDGSFSYTPNPDFDGADSFTYKANDGSADSNQATVTITVDPVNDAPVALADAYSTDEGTPLSVPVDGVLGNDTDVDGDALTAILVSGVSNGSLTLNTDGSFSYTPNSDFNGADSFDYNANDGSADSNVVTVDITVNAVNDAPVALGDAYSTEEDTPLSVPVDGVLVNDTDVDGDALTAVLVSDVGNGSLTLNTNGSFDYTPDGDFNGADSFTYMANDGNADSNVVTVDITVSAVNDAPVAAGEEYTTPENTLLTVTAPGVLGNDTDVDGPSLSAALVTGVSNGSLTLNTDGSFTYDPDPSFIGTDSFVYKANDGTADSGNATVTLTVTPVNDTPVAGNDSYGTDEDTPLNVPAPGVLGNDTDGDSDPLTASLVSNVSNGLLTLNSDGSFSYTPNADFDGTDSFSYVANDGWVDSNEATVTITVDPVADAPVAGDDGYSTDEDTLLSVTAPGVLGNDTDADGDPLTAVLASDVSNGVLALDADGSFTYNPNAGFGGSDSFTYRANDGSANSNLATVNITVNAVNDAPVAGDDTYSTNEDMVLTVGAPGVLGDDTDAEGDPLTAILVTDVSNGLLVLNADGSFSYTPDADFYGADSFTYRADDGSDVSNVATVNITVNAVNDAPVAGDDGYSTVADTELTVAAPGVLGNDSDVEGSPLTAVLVGDVGNGSLVLSSDGSFTYTPDPGFIGSDGFTYVANDSAADSNLASVTLTVNPLTPTIFEARVATGTDDAEEKSSGRVSFTSSDLELVYDRDIQTVGIRFTGVNVPQGAEISKAYVQFQADETQSEAAALTIQAQAADDTLTFDNVTNNITNRPTTVEEVAWSPAAWTTGQAGVDQQTPELAAVIQEVVGRPGWASGNSLVLIVSSTGTGKRVAEAYDGVSAAAPLLHVEYYGGQPNNPPEALGDNYSTNEDSPLNVAAPGVLANDTDADGDGLTAVLVADVSNGSLTLNADGSFDYTPDADFYGADSFTYKANDGVADSNVVTVDITVNAVNDAPVALDDDYSTQEDTLLTVNAPGVLNNDSDADGDVMTANLLSDVSNGSLALNADGSFTYTPGPGFIGTDSFTYEANDSQAGSNIATVTITVSPVNEAPVAGNDSYNTNEDTPLTVTLPGVLGNDTDGDGNALTASLVSGVSNGLLTLNDDGSFDYTPSADFNGTDSFSYVANDGWADSNVATVNITVNAVNDAPVATGDDYTTVVDTQLSVAAPGVLINDTDGDGDAMSAVLVSNPASGSLTLNVDGAFTYDPNLGFIGSDSFTYKANDGNLDSNVVTVNITVNSAAPVTLEVRVGASTDDAEEKPNGKVDVASNDLDIIQASRPQTVGIRFTGVTIPQGATIQSAYIQFQVDEVSEAAADLVIQGEAHDNAPTFAAVNLNITNRTRTSEAVAWTPAPWSTVGAAGVDQQTSDVALVIQEIVNRSTWAGDSLVIIISGAGARVAEAWDGDQAGAPLLHVEYVAPGG